MKCSSHLLMNAEVCKLAGWRLYGVISRPTAIKIACILCLFQYELIWSFSQFKYQLTHDVKTQSFYAHLFIIQTYPRTENTSQINYFSSQVQGSFLFLFYFALYKPKTLFPQKIYKPKTIFKGLAILPALSWLSPRVSFEIQQLELTFRYKGSLLCLQIINLFSGKISNLTFYINPIETAVKKIITTIFLKIS